MKTLLTSGCINQRGAGQCLYYAYHNHFEIVQPFLTNLRNDGNSEDMETWGRISALSVMAGHIDFQEFIRDLSTLDCTEAWNGAVTVWINTKNIRQHQDICLNGINAGLISGGMNALKVAEQLDQIFGNNESVILLPESIIIRCFSVFKEDEYEKNKHHRLFRFHDWLNAISQQAPDQALRSAEIYLEYIRHSKQYLYDYNNSLTQLMTRLFAEAEEREESDCGTMLQRVVGIQDILLSLGVDGVANWLKAAERP
ncbi:hypothetical protein [Dickeya zeae]|uniref:hypothetical protein n=1 Tax=Dickeya zeae TaxID=204042 RepID=UPI0018F80C3D|nr:hypothetical protein [Dickeya zeae]